VTPSTLPREEAWRWPETRWQSSEIGSASGRRIAAGVDVGSVSTQAVLLADGELYTYANLRTGSSSSQSAEKAMQLALESTGLRLQDIHACVGTGYGRVNVPFAKCTITEIACHARGAHHIYGPTVRTVLDMGGQDCKAIRCDEKGRVVDFLMNDKCAAGTGRGLEVFAELLHVPIQEMGALSLRVTREPPMVSSTCVVFAKSEALGLLRQGWSKEETLAAYHAAMANRLGALLRRLGVEKDFAITGGIAKNIGIVSRLRRELDVEPLTASIDPQIAGALGAALLADEMLDEI
jgi:bzd-type benzoyl-CoA reductase Q subunit